MPSRARARRTRAEEGDREAAASGDHGAPGGQADGVDALVRGVPARLPPSVDLRRRCSPVENQGDLGSCTGNALAGAVEFLEKNDRLPLVNVSRLFIYYNERVIEHSVREDAGAMLRDGIKTLVKQGVCSEKKWPYATSRFAVRPSPSCYKEAADHQVTAYARLQTVDEMRACLADGYPFVFGFTVYETFESDAVARTGKVPMPRPQENVLRGHALRVPRQPRSVGRL